MCDSCSDSTEEIARKNTEKVYNVNFTNVSKTRNFGAKRAEGRFLVFNDADTVVSKNYLSLIKRFLIKVETMELLGGLVKQILYLENIGHGQITGLIKGIK